MQALECICDQCDWSQCHVNHRFNLAEAEACVSGNSTYKEYVQLFYLFIVKHLATVSFQLGSRVGNKLSEQQKKT